MDDTGDPSENAEGHIHEQVCTTALAKRYGDKRNPDGEEVKEDGALYKVRAGSV
jgi:hypothetical protein